MSKISELLVSDPASALDGTEGFHAKQGAGSVGATVEQVGDYVLGRTAEIEALVLATVIAGLSLASTADVADGDSVLEAFGKLQAQIAAISGAADAMIFRGVIDCSANPNYPAADAGDTYRVSVAGKIGGGSGLVVEVGDLLLCITDATSSGNQATVGANWSVAQGNIDGAVIGPASVTDGVPALFDGTTGKLLKATTFAAFKTALAIAVGDVSGAAALASPTFTGTPAAPTAAPGTNTTQLATTAFVKAAADAAVGKPFLLIVAVSDESTDLTTGVAKVTFRMPAAVTLTAVRGSVNTAPTGGTLLAFDVKESGTTIFSTKPTFDASEKTTTTAATPAVISDASIADDAEITINIDAVGSTVPGAGLKVAFIGVYA